MRLIGESRSSPRILDAYRAAVRQNAIGSDDGSWVRVGMLLEHAALLPDLERSNHLRLAADAIRAAIGEGRWHAGHPTDVRPPADGHVLQSRLRIYSEQVEDAGALDMADAFLTAYLSADPEVDSLERARVESARARLAWKRGDLDVADERYRRVGAHGRRLRSDELKIRALTGHAIVARLRGNFPAARELGRRAVALAERIGHQRLASVAHQVVMVTYASAAEFPLALEHAWKAVLSAQGEQAMTWAALGNLAQLFVDAGHPAIAMMAFRAVLRQQPPLRIELPALGGLAMAAARLRDSEALADAASEIAVRTRAGASPYDTATAMLDLARAYGVADAPGHMEACREHVLQVAIAHGFHELEHHARSLARATPRLAQAERPLPPQAKAVTGALSVLAGV